MSERAALQFTAEQLVDTYYSLDEDSPERETIWLEIERLERAYGGRFDSMKMREFLDAAP